MKKIRDSSLRIRYYIRGKKRNEVGHDHTKANIYCAKGEDAVDYSTSKKSS